MALALPLLVAEAARAGMGCGGRTGGVGTSAGIVSEREWREATGGEPRPPSERDESERRTLSVRPPGVPPRALARAIPAVAGVAPAPPAGARDTAGVVAPAGVVAAAEAAGMVAGAAGVAAAGMVAGAAGVAAAGAAAPDAAAADAAGGVGGASGVAAPKSSSCGSADCIVTRRPCARPAPMAAEDAAEVDMGVVMPSARRRPQEAALLGVAAGVQGPSGAGVAGRGRFIPDMLIPLIMEVRDASGVGC